MSCVSCARTSSSSRPRVTTPEHISPESANISLTQNHMFLVVVVLGGGGCVHNILLHFTSCLYFLSPSRSCIVNVGCVHNILLHFTACLYFLSPSRSCIVNIGSTVYRAA